VVGFETEGPAGVIGELVFINFDYPWSFESALLLSNVLDGIVVCVFALRLKALLRHWGIPILCFLLIFTRLAITVTVLGFLRHQPAIEFVLSQKRLILSNLAVEAVTDLLIGYSFCYYALKGEGDLSRFGLRRYLLLFLDSGLLSFVMSFGSLIMGAHSLVNFLWFATAFLIPKVHANALLVALNTRHLWKRPMRIFGFERTLNIKRHHIHKSFNSNDIQVEVSRKTSLNFAMMYQDQYPTKTYEDVALY